MLLCRSTEGKGERKGGRDTLHQSMCMVRPPHACIHTHTHTCTDVQVDVVSKVGSKPMVLDTVRNMLDRGCPMLIDAKCVELLVVKVCYSPTVPVGLSL